MENVSLPITVTRAKVMPLVCLALVLSTIMTSGVLYYVVTQTKDFPPQIGMILPVFPWFLNLGAAIFLIKVTKPATITISHTSITVTPLPVLGYVGNWGQDLSSTDVIAVKAVDVNPITRLSLELKSNSPEIRIDPPQPKNAAAFAAQLANALNVKAVLPHA